MFNNKAQASDLASGTEAIGIDWYKIWTFSIFMAVVG